MSPVLRLLARATLGAVLVTAGSLLASASGSDLTSNEILIAALSGVVSFCTLAGGEYATPLNATVGVGKRG